MYQKNYKQTVNLSTNAKSKHKTTLNVSQKFKNNTFMIEHPQYFSSFTFISRSL